MAHSVSLTRNHKRILLEVLALSQEAKLKKLRNPESIQRMNEEYERAGMRILQNEIDCGRSGIKSGDNLFGWYIDQVYHSGKLAETELAQLAIDICEACGRNTYGEFCRITIMSTLFE
jgi:hypothetical protein